MSIGETPVSNGFILVIIGPIDGPDFRGPGFTSMPGTGLMLILLASLENYDPQLSNDVSLTSNQEILSLLQVQYCRVYFLSEF